MIPDIFRARATIATFFPRRSSTCRAQHTIGSFRAHRRATQQAWISAQRIFGEPALVIEVT